MTFLIDENLPWPIVERLMNDGHEVTFVSEIKLSMPDSRVLSQAAGSQIIMTEDKDFGDLVFRDRLPTQGVVLVRLAGMSMQRRSELVAAAVSELGEKLIGSFTVISHGGTRRQPLPTPGSTSRHEGEQT